MKPKLAKLLAGLSLMTAFSLADHARAEEQPAFLSKSEDNAMMLVVRYGFDTNHNQELDADEVTVTALHYHAGGYERREKLPVGDRDCQAGGLKIEAGPGPGDIRSTDFFCN